MEKKIQPEGSLLAQFLTGIEALPIEVTDALLKYARDEDERNVINMYTPALKNQFKELSSYISQQSTRASGRAMENVEQFLRISSPNLLMSSVGIALPSIQSVVGKLGIAGLFQEIKKILRKVLGAFAIRLPEWLDVLLTLIDEVAHILLGSESPKMRNALSEMEQNYLAELTQLAKLEKATRELNYDESDDDL